MSGKYDAARQAFGAGDLSWTGDPIMAQLVTAEYAYDAGHKDADALKGAVGDPVELTGKSVDFGYAKADKLVFRQIRGPAPAAIVFHRQAGTEGKSTLIFFQDNIVNFPMQTNGGDIEIATPPRGIFRV
jgi:hypothetical protein